MFRSLPRLVLLLAALGGVLAPSPAAAQGAEEGQDEFSLELKVPGYDRGANSLRLRSGAALEGAFVLRSSLSKPLPVRVVALLDYREVAGAAGKAAAGTVDVPPGREGVEIPLHVPAADNGEHLLVLVVFLLPDLHREDLEFRADSSLMMHYSAVRVLWGEGSTPAGRRPACLPAGSRDSEAEEGLSRFVLALPGGGDDPLIRAPGSGVAALASFNNPEDAARPCLVLGFLDYRQVPFAGGETLLCRTLAPRSATVVEGRIPRVEGGAPHEFLLLLVEDPFPGPDGASYPGVRSSQRVLVRTHEGP